MIKTAILAALALACAAPAAQASHHARHRTIQAVACIETGDVLRPVCGMGRTSLPFQTADRWSARRRPAIFRRAAEYVASEIVAHPRGCPRVAFCGCGAAVHIFGAPIRSLWLAANWFRFPRTGPAPGMVAVRRHHVFVLEAPISGDTWRVYDANSGGHLTRVHARSIAGWAIVNPRGPV